MRAVIPVLILAISEVGRIIRNWNVKTVRLGDQTLSHHAAEFFRHERSLVVPISIQLLNALSVASPFGSLNGAAKARVAAPYVEPLPR